jgi:hypothetical protein
MMAEPKHPAGPPKALGFIEPCLPMMSGTFRPARAGPHARLDQEHGAPSDRACDAHRFE